MRNDTLLVLGGFALILFFATSGARSAREIDEKMQPLETSFEMWQERYPDEETTRLMAEFIRATTVILGREPENLKTMTKQELLKAVGDMNIGPCSVLVKLSSAVKVSLLSNKKPAEAFCDTALKTIVLVHRLFLDVYSLLPGESRVTAKLQTEEIQAKLKRIVRFT
jgi:hypothetical protein